MDGCIPLAVTNYAPGALSVGGICTSSELRNAEVGCYSCVLCVHKYTSNSGYQWVLQYFTASLQARMAWQEKYAAVDGHSEFRLVPTSDFLYSSSEVSLEILQASGPDIPFAWFFL